MSPAPIPEQYNGPERRQPNVVTTQAIQQAVAEGIRQAVSDPAVWEAAGIAMHQQAKAAAGGWLLGGMGAVARRVGWVLLVAWGVYSLGGWQALVALIKANTVSPS